LSRAALAERLLEIAVQVDGGRPKTGRRYWYLALSHGYVSPDMGSSDAAKASRLAAQKRITEILGVLRKQGRRDMVLDLTRDFDQWQVTPRRGMRARPAESRGRRGSRDLQGGGGRLAQAHIKKRAQGCVHGHALSYRNGSFGACVRDETRGVFVS